jgi:catechol 2,3-dioxygenase-like lactoylglutathione lyase family enzyme
MLDPRTFNVVRHTRSFQPMLHFYRDLLGLTVVQAWDEPGNRGAILALGGRVENATVEILELAGRPMAAQAADDIEAGIYVDDVDAWHDELRARGVAIARGLEDTAWGHRSFGVDDPDGLRIWFVQVLERAPAPEIYPMPSFPTLSVTDLAASKAFYVEALGFQVIYSFAPAGGPSMLEHLRWARYADLLLVPGGPDEGRKGRGLRLTFSAALAGRTGAEIAERARAHGANVEGPVERPYNVREVVVTDPDGFVLVFTEPVDLDRTFDDVMGDVEQAGG